MFHVFTTYQILFGHVLRLRLFSLAYQTCKSLNISPSLYLESQGNELGSTAHLQIIPSYCEVYALSFSTSDYLQRVFLISEL